VFFDVPDMAIFQSRLESQATAHAMASDGMRADTVVVLVGVSALGSARRVRAAVSRATQTL
jgi:hypothetical protein